MTMYVATRNTATEMQTVLNTTRIPMLTQKFAKTLRQAAMDNGIKQTVQGKRLEFYSVDSDTFDRIKDRQDMLIAINANKMQTELNTVNSKPDYQGGMGYDVHQKYLKELRNAMKNVVQPIGADTAPEKKTRPAATHDYAVGDWIELYGDWGHFLGNARITRVTKSSYWYEVAEIRGGRFSNFNRAKNIFNDVTGFERDSQEWDFTVPYAGNEDAFTFQEPRMARASAKQYGNPSKIVAGYRSMREYN